MAISCFGKKALMGEHSDNGRCPLQPAATVEEVNRVLEVGRLLLSVLTPEELQWLSEIAGQTTAFPVVLPEEIGNTRDS
jgi:hypothetical protein